MEVAVVGGGIVGLCVAEALVQRGAQVTLFEAGEIGAGASAGNAGWITPSHAAPLPAPGMMPRAIRWMVQPGSPLLVRPQARLSFGHWLYDFWRNTKPSRYSAGLAALVALAQRTVPDYEALAARHSLDIEHAGLLYVGRTEAALEEEWKLHQDQRMLGYSGRFELLDHRAALAHEPGLNEHVEGAILALDDRHVRPEALTGALEERLRECGVQIRAQTPVRRISRDGSGWQLDGERDRYKAERVVVAGGVATASLLAPLGVALPLEGAKGYSITMERSPVALRGPIYLLEDKVAVSPYGPALRLAGTLELGSSTPGVNRTRVASIERAGRQALKGLDGAIAGRAWAGFRPLLPDGLPAIGPVPGHPGLHVATGHAMLGITLAPTTAALVAPAVLDEAPSAELAAFSIARFDNRGDDSVDHMWRRDSA